MTMGEPNELAEGVGAINLAGGGFWKKDMNHATATNPVIYVSCPGSPRYSRFSQKAATSFFSLLFLLYPSFTGLAFFHDLGVSKRLSLLLINLHAALSKSVSASGENRAGFSQLHLMMVAVISLSVRIYAIQCLFAPLISSFCILTKNCRYAMNSDSSFSGSANRISELPIFVLMVSVWIVLPYVMHLSVNSRSKFPFTVQV
eukprot:g9307.t1